MNRKLKIGDKVKVVGGEVWEYNPMASGRFDPVEMNICVEDFGKEGVIDEIGQDNKMICPYWAVISGCKYKHPITTLQKIEDDMKIERVSKIKISEKLMGKTYTPHELDLMYLTGVFNIGGIDGLSKELARLKELGKMPHEMIVR